MKIMNYDTDKIIKGKTYRVNKHIGRVNGDSTANVRESLDKQNPEVTELTLKYGTSTPTHPRTN